MFQVQNTAAFLRQEEEPVMPKSTFKRSTERTLELGKGIEMMPHTHVLFHHTLYVKQQGLHQRCTAASMVKETQSSEPHCSSPFTGSLSTCCEPRALLTGETPRTEPSPGLKKRTFWWDR